MTLETISGGTFRLDGGAMFGVVPRPLWQRLAPPDDRNRVALDANCLLIRGGGRTILVDTGYGHEPDERQRDRHALEPRHPLLENLADRGVDPRTIDLVILTHLHFDHAGGCIWRDAAGGRRLSFPDARHVVQRAEWEDAMAELPELAGSYRPADLRLIEEAGRLELVEGTTRIAPGVTLRPTGGHSRGHQMLSLGDAEQAAIYPADLCPTTAHLRTRWTMAYDQFPLEVRRLKPKVLGEAVDTGQWVLFAHDPRVRTARLSADGNGQFLVSQTLE